ncbi:MAG: hypothetical protein K2K68_00010 [Duncaniella sp.]|nr:hypothetical protein [Duncaniella sp.]MDE6484460.1 hypothetical protein [Duncaniella sp.]
MDKNVNKPADEYRGVDVNVADNEKVNAELVKEETAALNNNPRDNNLDE